jgi:hypothetical protein
MPTETIIQALERGPGLVVPLVRAAAPSILKRRPPNGKWSIHEHACHLGEVDALMTRRLDLMLAEEHPRIRSYDPGRDEPDGRLQTLDLDDALARYAQDRGRLIQRLRHLRPTDWQRTAIHDEYNSYSVLTMFRHLALHDFFHAYRIEELVLRKDWPPPRV